MVQMIGLSCMSGSFVVGGAKVARGANSSPTARSRGLDADATAHRGAMDRHRPPYDAYAEIVGMFVGGLAAAAALARALGREPDELSTIDLVALAGATFKASRTISHDKVASFLREPFVEGEAYDGDEEPAGEGMQRAIGELVTCSRCVGTWVGAGLAASQVVAPRFGRLLTWSLAAAAANDFLQTAFIALNRKSEELAERV
jgi:uncharacterized protein DUF1360